MYSRTKSTPFLRGNGHKHIKRVKSNHNYHIRASQKAATRKTRIHNKFSQIPKEFKTNAKETKSTNSHGTITSFPKTRPIKSG